MVSRVFSQPLVGTAEIEIVRRPGLLMTQITLQNVVAQAGVGCLLVASPGREKVSHSRGNMVLWTGCMSHTQSTYLHR